MSTPQMSNPITLEILSAKNIFSGCIISVTSTEVPPVLKLAVDFKNTTSSDFGIVEYNLVFRVNPLCHGQHQFVLTHFRVHNLF
jgi:hypothetical protein